MADTPVTEFGARLKEARQARGVSLAHIANVTKISVRSLEAVERNEFSRLPGGIFTRSFVRAYAEEVGLDPEAALKAFLDQCPQDAAAVPNGTPESIDGSRMAEWQEKVSWRHAAVVVGVIAVVGMSGYWLLMRSGGPASSGEELEPPAMATGPLEPPTATAPEAVSTRPAAEPAPEATAPSSPAAPPAVALAARPKAPIALALAVTAPCWMSITADGVNTASRLFAAGERVDVTASREVVLKVGDAAALSWTVNGSPARALGASGRVVTVRVGLDNLQSFLLPR